jgi:hypothetical protein
MGGRALQLPPIDDAVRAPRRNWRTTASVVCGSPGADFSGAISARCWEFGAVVASLLSSARESDRVPRHITSRVAEPSVAGERGTQSDLIDRRGESPSQNGVAQRREPVS